MDQFPKMIYGPEGRTHILPTAQAERPEGDWSDTPGDEHRQVKPDHFFSTQIDPNAEKRRASSDLADEVAGIVLQRLRDDGYSIEKKRGPGRPPKTPSSEESDDNG